MGLFIGDSEPSKIFVGDTPISKVFVWDTQVWPSWWLPSIYQEVEYIESTWTQYIDSWVPWTNNYIAEAKFLFTGLWGSTDDRYILWSAWNYPAYTVYISKQWIWGTSKWRMATDNTDGWWWDIYANTLYTARAEMLTSPYCTLYVNWNMQASYAYTNPYSCGYNLWILGWIWPNWGFNMCEAYLYYLKIWQSDGTTLVRDFVPCYRKSDNVIWLYDLVGKQFYMNAWTWTFLKWPDV